MNYQLKNWQTKLLNEVIEDLSCLDKEQLPAFYRSDNQYGRIESNVFSDLLNEFGIYILSDWESEELSIHDFQGKQLTEIESIEKCKEIRKAKQIEQEKSHIERAKSGNGFTSITTNVDATKNNAKIHSKLKSIIESPIYDKIPAATKIALVNKGCERANEAIVGKSTMEIFEMAVEWSAFVDKLSSIVNSVIAEKTKKKFSERIQLDAELKKPKGSKGAKGEKVHKGRNPEQYEKQKATIQAKKKQDLQTLLGMENPRAAFEEFLKSKNSAIETVKVEERNYNS